MPTQTTFDPNAPTTPEDRLAVEICLHKVLDAARAGDAELLASHHLYEFDAEGDHIAVRARCTLVFVQDDGQWKIAHEHLSPFKSNP